MLSEHCLSFSLSPLSVAHRLPPLCLSLSLGLSHKMRGSSSFEQQSRLIWELSENFLCLSWTNEKEKERKIYEKCSICILETYKRTVGLSIRGSFANFLSFLFLSLSLHYSLSLSVSRFFLNVFLFFFVRLTDFILTNSKFKHGCSKSLDLKYYRNCP